jgi:hypothetical protein
MIIDSRSQRPDDTVVPNRGNSTDVDQAMEDDRLAALALSQGNPLPPPSRAQRTLETIMSNTKK